MSRTSRYGTFEIDSHFWRHIDITDGRVDGSNLFDGMVVVDVETLWNRDAKRYKAIHAQFREVKAGELLPEYRAIFDKGATVPRWEEVKLSQVSDEAYDKMLAEISQSRPLKAWKWEANDAQRPLTMAERIARWWKS